jgi:hypothetical protein
MNYESDRETAESIEAARSDAREHGVNSDGERCANGIAHQRPQRWAWTAANGHYDWMDSHGPFAGLD